MRISRNQSFRNPPQSTAVTMMCLASLISCREKILTDNSVPHSDRSDNSVASSILERAKLGDQDAFQSISKLYSGLVYYWCREQGLKPEDAEDVGQQVFVAVSRNLKTFRRERAEDSFRAWLRIITKAKIADHYRKTMNREVSIGGEEQWKDLAASEQNDEENAEDIRRDTAMLYQRAMRFIQGEFAEKNVTAFLMLVVDGLSAKDVSEKLSMSVNEVYLAKSRILKRLHIEFADLIDDKLD